MKKILKAVASTLMTGISAFVISGMTGSTCVLVASARVTRAA